MIATLDPFMTTDEERVMRRLRECGTSSFEELPGLLGLDWVTVFSIIDRLTRAGSVVLKKHGADYRVSLENGT